jgi:hypothetical protein
MHNTPQAINALLHVPQHEPFLRENERSRRDPSKFLLKATIPTPNVMKNK